MTNFDDDDREADQIRLKRIGQEQNRAFGRNEETKKGGGTGDFERIFHDSGIEFNHFNA